MVENAFEKNANDKAFLQSLILAELSVKSHVRKACCTCVPDPYCFSFSSYLSSLL